MNNLYPLIGQQPQLLIKSLLEYPLRWSPDQEIVYRDIARFTYRQFNKRVHRLANLLTRCGIGKGDRVGVMDWDSHRYLEFFFAVPMIGAILHTINVRLSPEQVVWTINHAEDKLLAFHTDFLPLVEQTAPALKTIESYIRLEDHAGDNNPSMDTFGDYENLLGDMPDSFDFADFDENTVATTFYTTGTTGDPKGVFFTHRQLVLHTITSSMNLAAYPGPAVFRADDTYMPITPMFHVHAWGVPYMATVLGVKQVYPGRYEPQMLLNLLLREKVTFSHCVPTIMAMILNNPATRDLDLSGWKVIIGGAALPRGLAELGMERGIHIVGGYGMSETCPVIAISHLKPDQVEASSKERLDIATKTGFPIPLVRSSIMDANGNHLPPGPGNVGELVLQAPWLTQGYFKEPEKSEELWAHGWLHTGDIAYIDDEGYIRITDRLKDVIKIGGEWISSLELEDALSQHNAVADVSVIGMPDKKWDERPLAYIVLREGNDRAVNSKDLLSFLRPMIENGSIHKRAILTKIRIVDSIPKTGVGKSDKKALRQQLEAESD